MTLQVTAALSTQTTVWPGLPRCTIELSNTGDEVVRWVNDGAVRHQCGLVLTRPDTGETLRWDPARSGFLDPPEQRLEAGASMREDVPLGSRGNLPGPGRWELRARATCSEGEVLSEPVVFDVVAAPITGFDLASSSGRPDGHALCAWVATAHQGSVVGLSTVSTVYTPSFVSSTIACSASGGVWPVLSVPPRRSARAPHIAWVDGKGVHWVVVQPTAYGVGSMECEHGWQLVSPLTEHDGGAEGLLVRVGEGAWSLRVVRFESATLGVPQSVAGPPPMWGKLVVHGDGRRDVATLHPGPGGMTLLRTRWPAGGEPDRSQHAATLPGAMLAADFRATLGTGSAGMVLATIEGTPARVVAHRFRIADPDADLRAEQMREVELPEGSTVAQAHAGLDETGVMHALLCVVAPDGTGRWVLWGESRGLVELPDEIATTSTPRSLIFLHGTRPTLVWTDPRAGLRVHPVDPPLVPTPTG